MSLMSMIHLGGGNPFFIKTYSCGSGVKPNQINFVSIAVGFTMLDSAFTNPFF